MIDGISVNRTLTMKFDFDDVSVERQDMAYLIMRAIYPIIQSNSIPLVDAIQYLGYASKVLCSVTAYSSVNESNSWEDLTSICVEKAKEEFERAIDRSLNVVDDTSKH